LPVLKGDRDANIKIYPELNELDQKDERLIAYLRDYILIKPPIACRGKKKNKLCKKTLKPKLQKSPSQYNLAGQYHQPEYVEKLLGLREKRKLDNSGKATQKVDPEKQIQSKKRKSEWLHATQVTKSSKSKTWCPKTKFPMIIQNRKIPPSRNNRPVNGFFIEAGAGDGEIISNTLYFELLYKWTGLLVEPNPDFHDALISKNRNAWILPHCLSTKTSPIIVDFFADLLLGGIINEVSSSTPHKLESDGELSRKIKVQCFPLYSVLRAIGNPRVDYFSLDIEGPEFQVLKTVPWDLVDIRVLGIETEHAGKVFNGTKRDISSFLQSAGFKETRKIGHDSFFVKK